MASGTEWQEEVAQLIADGITARQYAESHGLNLNTAHYRYRATRAKTMVRTTHDNIERDMIVSKVSTMSDKNGETKIQWVQAHATANDVADQLEAIAEGLKADIEPLPPMLNIPECDSDILACHVLSDYHLGMFAHKEESGEDWDIDMAQDTMNKWIDKSISLSPNAETGLFLQLGDFLHSDGIDPVTPASRHLLDVGCRFQKIISAAIQGIKRTIARMLEKHKYVHVILASANHDPTSSMWLRSMFATLYENEPRVTIDTTEHPYYCYEWGDTSIFAHHGHKRGLGNVSATFAGLYREVFGRTKFSYGHIGHFHHTEVKEDNLMQVEIHSTLAPKDAYAAHGGYLANRKTKTVLYSKVHGEIGSFNITPSML